MTGGPRRWHAELAWLPSHGLMPDVLIEATGDRFTEVRPGVTGGRGGRAPAAGRPDPARPRQRATRTRSTGRCAAARRPGRGTFWTWREQMYATAARLDPDCYLALARAVYAEMALAGITCVGEFHYLHHGTGGRRYADPNEMGKALIEAARQAGIRITLLDTCYLSGGLDASGAPVPLAGPQLRFSDGDGHGWAERVAALGAGEHGELGPRARLGAAIHSVRAVPPDQLPPVLAWAQPHGGAGARAPVRAARRERGLPGRLRRHPGRGAVPGRGSRPARHDGPRHPPDRPGHRADRRQPGVRLLLPDHRGGPGRRDRPGPGAGRRREPG